MGIDRKNENLKQEAEESACQVPTF